MGDEELTKTISFSVKDQLGDVVQFKAKMETPFQKIIKSYASQKGIEEKSFRLVHDGNRIGPLSTPKDLEMEEGDEILMIREVEGGGEGDDGEPISIRVRDQQGDEVTFKVKKSTKMAKIFNAYAMQKGVEVKTLRFRLDGEMIGPDNTPKMLELEDNDQIDCMTMQVGGGVEESDTITVSCTKNYSINMCSLP